LDFVCSIEQAIAACGPSKYDVVITDYHLADVEAPEIIKTISEMSPNFPIAVISSSVTPERVKAAQKNGACVFIEKKSAVNLLERIADAVLH